MKLGKHLIMDCIISEEGIEDLYNKEKLKNIIEDVTKSVGLRPLSDVMLYEVNDTHTNKRRCWRYRNGNLHGKPLQYSHVSRKEIRIT